MENNEYRIVRNLDTTDLLDSSGETVARSYRFHEEATLWGFTIRNDLTAGVDNPKHGMARNVAEGMMVSTLFDRSRTLFPEDLDE